MSADTADLFNLSGKVAVITGAASGMGRATAITLAHAGADIVLGDINRSGMEETAAGGGTLRPAGDRGGD